MSFNARRSSLSTPSCFMVTTELVKRSFLFASYSSVTNLSSNMDPCIFIHCASLSLSWCLVSKIGILYSDIAEPSKFDHDSNRHEGSLTTKADRFVTLSMLSRSFPRIPSSYWLPLVPLNFVRPIASLPYFFLISLVLAQHDFECEVRTFFAYGANLQELYLVPSIVDSARYASAIVHNAFFVLRSSQSNTSTK